MKFEDKGFAIGDKFGAAGVIALVAGCGLYGFGVENPDFFQTFLLNSAIVIAVVGVGFLALSYRAHMLSWQTSRLNKVVATTVLLLLAGSVGTINSIAAVVVIAVLGAVCLAFTVWKGIRLLKSKKR